MFPHYIAEQVREEYLKAEHDERERAARARSSTPDGSYPTFVEEVRKTEFFLPPSSDARTTDIRIKRQAS
jgi:hypothetical protein